MPATTLAHPAQTAPSGQQSQLVVPFVRAAQEHIEGFLDVSQQIGASGIPLAPVDLPAYGFVRGVYIEVTATGGSGTVAVAKGDAPFTALTDISIMDVNGAPIVGPLDGYDVLLANKYGGYRRVNTQRHPDFKAVQTDGTFSFLIYVPIEVNQRDGLGSLANLNAASSYKLRATVAAASSVYSTNPTTLPTVRVRAWLDAWTQPAATDLAGNAQATQPPAHGTTSFWSKNVVNVSAGAQTIKLQRVGNLIRDMILIYRDTNGVRNSTNFPAPLDLYWDTRLLKSYQPIVWRSDMSERFSLYNTTADAADGLNTGVFVHDFMHEFDGKAGVELRDGWLPTVQSTRLELNGVFGAAGTLTVLTNDVAPQGEVFV